MLTNERIRVALLYGGRNSEHEVSCRSAAGVLRFLDPGRYDVVPIRITREGRWSAGAGHPARGIAAAYDILRSVDVAFPCLHGPYGEDGTVQAVLELAGVPYVGSGVLAGATAMDKEFTKKIVAAEGIAVADGVVLREGSELSADDRTRLGLPVFVKPARGGSSVGVTRVGDWADLPAAVASARRHDAKVLVEAAVSGREIDIGLLQAPDGTVLAGPALEIRVDSSRPFFDFDAKYRAGSAEFVIPAALRPEEADVLAGAARRVFDILGCRGLLRADFFLTDAGVPVLNEVNTMPGLTELSQFPQIWRAAGVSYPDLLDRLVTTALAPALTRVP